MYNMIPYKSKVIHFENGILNISTIRKRRNDYPRKEYNSGDESIMVLLYDDNLGNNIISGNTDISRNIIMESIYVVLYYIHIGLHTGDVKYRI